MGPGGSLRRSEEPGGTGLVANLAIAALVALILLPLLLVEPFRLVEARLYDILSTIDPPRPAEPGVTIVAIDEPSFQEINRRWPWPRTVHADLVRSLREAGAAVIGLDVIFADPTTPEADGALAAAVGPDTVLAADDVTIALDQGTQTSRVMPLDSLLDGQALAGTTAVDLDGDGYQRRMPAAPDTFAREALRLAGHPAEPAPPGALVQYFGPPRTYPTVSFYQALDPARFLPPGRLKGRIVFVGLSLKAAPDARSGATDAFLTPYTLATGSLTAGAEVQATILDNLRHRLFVVPVGRPAMALLVIAGALGAALLAGRKTSWRTGVVGAVSILCVWGAAYALLRYGRLWAPPALPVGAMVGVFGARLGLDFARERQLRRQVSEAFSRYISPDLVAELARDPSALKLGGERRNLSVLFCDVRGFTTMSEKLKDEPERLTALINRLLDALSGAVLAEGGTIDKYMGDCVMAFWNAPLPAPDHPVRAVRAALAMIEAVRALNADLRREGDDPDLARFAVGVGINTGDCVVGNVGSRWRYDYSVLGDTVNLASRLEGLSKEYGVSVILGPETAERVREAFVLLELDRIAVRGRATATAIYTVVGPASRRAEPAIQALEAGHPRLLAALRGADGATAGAEAERLRALVPDLAPYYDKLLARYGPALGAMPAREG
jgi:adenylate cyclase